MQTLHLMLTGGEPMVHPDFFRIGSLAKDLGFVTRIRTNGHNLSGAMARRLRNEVDPFSVEISLHGASASTHDKQTQVAGSFDRLMKNVGYALKENLRVGFVTTPTLWNEHEIRQMYQLAGQLDVPLRFQGPVAPRDNGDTAPLAIQPSAFAWEQIAQLQQGQRPAVRERSLDAQAKVDETASTCSVGVAGVDIDPFGNVLACMHLQERAGNLHEQGIEDIWLNSPLFARARQRAVAAAEQFQAIPLKQLGAPLFCLAVEENCNKGCESGGCGRHNG